ncbi:unnamed protein product [Adineta ricciae]|uniref:beta-N-acetylhexosaminidase n=1 Tax=Adineta ricciae TaxID=249248 RepID=A0A813PCR9_ADIRI|nr:unnamed protein product [Adineta ricciae]
MIYDDSMDTEDQNLLTSATFDVNKFRLSNESDEQWFYRKQFIEAYRFEYNKERLLCLAQCYANTKCLGCKYSEPLKSLLDQLSEKFSTSSIKRSPCEEPIGVNIKRISPMSNVNKSSMQSNVNFSNTSNFVSFSSSLSSHVPPLQPSPTQQIIPPKTNPKTSLNESPETKLTRLRAFTNQLKQSLEAAQNRTGNNENDHAIEHIYQVGTQQHLFVDYRPDEQNDQSNSYISPANAFLTKTFRSKLYIDDVYICAGEGTNKKFCKRNCFQKALNRFLYENFNVKMSVSKDGREQYELITAVANNVQEVSVVSDDEQDKETFAIPTNHPMANTKINFVHARDTLTIAGRTARQQSELEKQYWQQWGRGVPMPLQPKRIQRSLSPPPPVPHLKIEDNSPAVIEGLATTPASIANVISEMEHFAEKQQKLESINNPESVLLKTTLPTNSREIGSIMNTQSTCSEAASNAIDPNLLSQQRAKLAKMQPFLFSLLNSLADASHAIDLISTQCNKYHLHANFECPDKATLNGFHGHLIVEQIEVADGYGLNKKLAKKQVYSNALKSISSAKSFSLDLRHQIRWTLVCHDESSGLLKIPLPRRPMAVRDGEDRPSRWGPPTNLSAVTSSSTSAIRYFHERRVEEGSQREREYQSTNGICIPPPALIEPPLTRSDIGKDISKCTSSTDEAIANNIRRLIPNTFVVFELLDFDENIPGHYVSMLFTSMSKNKLELKYEFVHVPNGCMITYSINNRFFMSWIAPTKVAAKQIGAKKAIEMLKTLYPSIKSKHVVTDMSMNENEISGVKCRLIRRAQLYDHSSSAASLTTANNNLPQKEDMGSKLLKKMGWVGGGIGKDLQGIAEPIQIEDLQGRKGLGSSSLFPNQTFVKNLRQILEEFIATNDDDGELQFANEFNSEERKSIHKEAMKLHLTSNSYGRDGERRIRVTQKRNVDQLVDHLLTHGGETARYELKVQTQPKLRSSKIAQQKYSQMAPPPSSQWPAPDACDDGNLYHGRRPRSSLNMFHVEPSVGQPWPKPQSMQSTPQQFAIHPSAFHFMINSTSQTCDTLTSAFDRYYRLIFFPQTYFDYILNPASATDDKSDKPKKSLADLHDATILKRLNIHMQQPCEQYPTLESDESYTLTINTDNSMLESVSVWGALRGLETFSQLIYADDDLGFAINQTVINDFPRFAHRGLLLDTSRHFISVKTLKMNLEAMAQSKLNVFHFHIVDDQSFPYESRTYPELSGAGAYNQAHVYSQDDIAGLIEFARQRGIRVVVEFDSPGHTQSWGLVIDVLTHCYSGGKPNNEYGPMDPSRNSTFDFLKKMFSEVANVFPDHYVHLGGDEVDFDCWRSNPNVQAFMRQMEFGNDYSLLEQYYMQNVVDIVGSTGKGYAVWQEIIDNNVTVKADTVVEVWKDPYPEELARVTKLGYRTLLSTCWYLNYISYGKDWIPYYKCDPHNFVGTDEQKKLVVGGEACMWGEFIDATNVIPTTWPRAAIVAERLWSSKNVTDPNAATPRLEEHRCRSLRRGIPASPVNGPSYCDYEYDR